MPTYEYRCRDCGREFDVFQRMSDQPGAPCPDCGRWAERLISGGAGVLFKGDGFYITDYRSQDYRKRAREEAGVGSGKGAGGGEGPASSAGASQSSSASQRSAESDADVGRTAGKVTGKAAGTRSSDGGTAAQGS